MKIHKNFREKVGGLPYYKGKITNKYELYLNNLIKKPVVKKMTPKKPQPKKTTVKKTTPKKAQPKKPPVKKTTPKKPQPKKSTIKKIPPKSITGKKKPPVQNQEPLNLESTTYNKLTGKNAIYGGKVTKAFESWKLKRHKEFKQKVGGMPYYKGALTQKYEKYLNSL